MCALFVVAGCFSDESGSGGEETSSGEAGGATAEADASTTPASDSASETAATGTESSTSSGSTSSGPDCDPQLDDCPAGEFCVEGACLPVPDLWYPFDGDAFDKSGNADGVEVGVTYEPGYQGMAVSLGAPNVYVDASAFASDYVSAIDGVSIAIRFFPEAYVSPLHVLLGLGTSGDTGLESNAFILGVRENDLEVYTETDIGTDHFARLGPAPAPGSWHKVVFVFDSGVVRLYVNGALQEVLSYTPPESTSGRLLVGGLDGNWFSGLVDDVRIWLHPLTDDDALQLSYLGS